MARIKKAEQEKTTQNTRQKLLDAAAGEFARAGYQGANINSISVAAGYAKGTVYNYFPSKQALLIALIETAAQQHFDFVVSRVRPEPDPARRLEKFFQAGFDFVACYLPKARVLFNTINDPDEPLKARVFECYQPMFQFLAAEILAPGVDMGKFRPMEPAAMSTLLMTVYLGTASQHNLQGKPWLEAKQVADLVLHGLLRPKEVEHDRS
jgi:AcrR family transcriptional regulator